MGWGAGFAGTIKKIFFYRTARVSCCKFGMFHCFVVLNKVSRNSGPRIQNGFSPGWPGLKPYKYIGKYRNSFLEPLASGREKSCPRLHWLKPIQNETEFLQHIKFE